MTEPLVKSGTGNAILGAGLLGVAFSIAYVGHGVISRFDKIESLAETAKATVTQVEGTLKEVQAVQSGLKSDLTLLRSQFPALGAETGEAAGTAIGAMRERLGCEKDEAGCIRGRIGQALGGSKP